MPSRLPSSSSLPLLSRSSIYFSLYRLTEYHSRSSFALDHFPSSNLSNHLPEYNSPSTMAHYPSTYAGSRKPTVFEDPVRIEVQAWADKATEAMHTVFISSRPARGTSVTLAIPPDEQHTARSTEPKETAPHRDATSSGYTPRRKPLRRDSLERREALLKGKEGSRRRQRWENGSFLPHTLT